MQDCKIARIMQRMGYQQQQLDKYIQRIERLTGITPCQQNGPIGLRGRPTGTSYEWVDRYLFEPFLYDNPQQPTNMQEQMTLRPAGHFIPTYLPHSDQPPTQGTPYRDVTTHVFTTIRQLDRLLTAINERIRRHPPTEAQLRMEQQTP